MGKTEEIKATAVQADIQLVLSRRTAAKKVKFYIRFFQKHYPFLTKEWPTMKCKVVYTVGKFKTAAPTKNFCRILLRAYRKLLNMLFEICS